MSDLVLKKPHFADTTDPGYFWQSMPTALLGGMALGGGARLVRNLVDLYRDEPGSGSTKIHRPTSSVSEVPVEITPEEAEELERQGIHVRRKLAQAHGTKALDVSQAPSSPESVQVYKTRPTLLGGLGVGALGTAGALGGWYLLDKVIDKMRERSAKGDIERVRGRIRGLLEDDPDEEDARVYGTMKAAEDSYFSQPVEKQQKLAIGMSDLPWLLSALVGGGLTFGALSGYQKAKRESPHKAKAELMRKYLEGRSAVQPRISMVPVLRQAREQQEEEKRRPTALAPVPETIVRVVDEPPGSPATQARENAGDKQPAPNWF